MTGTSGTPRFQAVPPGSIAAVATTLECRAAPAQRAEPEGLAGRIAPRPGIEPEHYLRLYRHIGADHLWFSRLYMAPDELRAVLEAPGTEVFTYELEGREEGILELDFGTAGDCEIKYFGVSAVLQGTGAARRLMNFALRHAFGREGVARVWLHTNTIDHPRALAFYGRSGFRAVAQEIEIAPDPRLRGVLPREAAPHVPIFE